MRFGYSFSCLTIVACTLFGCDEQPPADTPAAAQSPVNAPTTAPVVAHDAEGKPIPPARPMVVMLIDGEQREFPAPRLLVDDRNGKTVALLMSDDPPQAINDDYTGNSYYLELEFDDQLPTIRGQVWEYEAPDSEKQDSPSGIFLNGNRKQLQPCKVRVQFQQIDGGDLAWISGTFRVFTANDQPGGSAVVSVTARLPVTLP